MARAQVFKKVAHSGDIGFNMTPMIDCTFQLIIFFILTSQVANEEYSKEVFVPRPQDSKAVRPKDLNVPKVTVNVISIDPRRKTPDPLDEAAALRYEIKRQRFEVGDLDGLIEHIRGEKARFELEHATPGPEGKQEFFMEVRADKKISWQDVAPVIRAGVAAGIRKMNITALTYQK
ncbi:MAG: biopolymer transporter ExbD [Phycisphaerae bacterium]